ncbi:hypothetical protein E3V55_01130 [Candidatus Marinimicrobia bacterium MT.SAG.3]|nr:hypothetical protein E3V55_01130 [Candidatus Marinimicrobia bacterium MT.SAG.3]
MAGNLFELGQLTVKGPGDGQTSIFQNGSFIGNFGNGDMAFQLLEAEQVNQPPTADAGTDQTVLSARLFNLTAAARAMRMVTL